MTISIAPMMDRTDRHFRAFLRCITRDTLLYTEMVHVEAILRGDRERVLGFSDLEHPLVLQLGGSDANKLAECARIAQDMGYDGVNLNVGCPSDRVQHGGFGACLMTTPEVVADAVEAMQKAVEIPVSVKHRLGVDDEDRYEHVVGFVERIVQSGCRWIIVHARKAWLQGLSPHDNRTIPPLRHAEVYQLKRDFPTVRVETNGGIESLAEAADHLASVDGVMIGRWAYDDPMGLASVDTRFFAAETPVPDRSTVLECYQNYLEEQLAAGVPVRALVQHIHGLFAGRPGARAWRRALSDAARNGGDAGVLRAAQAALPGGR